MAIEERVPTTEQIILSENDATTLAANAVSFDRHILLSSCSQPLRRQLDKRGFTVIETPLDAFLRSGGSACCLTLRIDHAIESAAALA